MVITDLKMSKACALREGQHISIAVCHYSSLSGTGSTIFRVQVVLLSHDATIWMCGLLMRILVEFLESQSSAAAAVQNAPRSPSSGMPMVQSITAPSYTKMMRMTEGVLPIDRSRQARNAAKDRLDSDDDLKPASIDDSASLQLGNCWVAWQRERFFSKVGDELFRRHKAVIIEAVEDRRKPLAQGVPR
jgi:hypothetical protein